MKKRIVIVLLAASSAAAATAGLVYRYRTQACPPGALRLTWVAHHQAANGLQVTLELTREGTSPRRFGLVADPPATSLRELLVHERKIGWGVATQDYPSSYAIVEEYTFEPDGRYTQEHREGSPSSPARTTRTGAWTLAGRNAACIVLDPPAPGSSSGAR